MVCVATRPTSALRRRQGYTGATASRWGATTIESTGGTGTRLSWSGPGLFHGSTRSTTTTTDDGDYRRPLLIAAITLFLLVRMHACHVMLCCCSLRVLLFSSAGAGRGGRGGGRGGGGHALIGKSVDFSPEINQNRDAFTLDQHSLCFSLTRKIEHSGRLKASRVPLEFR